MTEDNPSPLRRALLVGTDEVLLYTRKQMLQKQGFDVSIVEPSRAIDRLHASNPAVIIACHTLSTQEADALIQAARALARPPALISFTRQLAAQPTDFPFDLTVWSLASPEDFLHKVQELLLSSHATQPVP